MAAALGRTAGAAAALGLVVAGAAAGLPAADAGLRAGEEAGAVWIEVPAGGSFRLQPDAGSSRLVFPDWSAPATGTVDLGLARLASLRLEAEGAGTAVLLPFAPGDLRGVEASAAGWRFTFAAGGAADDDGDYRLGVRDTIEISVFGHEDLGRIDAVPPDGVLTVPLIGEVQLAGRTVHDVEAEIQQRLGAEFLVDPKVSVRVKEYESQWVNVVGMVRTPGKYPIKGRTSLIDILTQAGGLAEKAGSRILVTRPDEAGRIGQIEVSREALFSIDNARANVPMRHGDVVDVLPQAMFYIQGEVIRPGGYPLERGYTLLKAISIAGGVSQWADRKEVELHRQGQAGAAKIVVNLKAVEQRKQPDMELLPEDIIIVKRRLL